MNSIFYTGVSGMVGFQQNMDVLAHNMANVNTVGFKPGRTAFNDLLYTKMAVNKEEKPLEGHGVKADRVQTLFDQGSPVATGYPLDFALMGDGFFAAEKNGERMYTRNGAFDISVEGKRGFLVTQDGSYVLDNKGKRIQFTKDKNDSSYDLTGLADKIGVYTFENPYALQPTSGGFLATDEAGKATGVVVGRGKDKPYQIIEHALENSAVDLTQAMTDIMMSQKAYQFNARIVQTADQIEEILNGLR